MIIISKKEEISVKDINKIIDSIDKLDKRLKDEAAKLDKKAMDESAKLDKKLSKQVTNNENQIKTLETNLKNLKTEIDNNHKILKTELDSMNKKLTGEMGALKKAIELNQKQIQDQIKNQEEIITSMIKKFDEKFLRDKSKLTADIEELKNQQDVLKISFTFNEKQLLQKMQATINEDIKKAVKGKEKEVLMKFWIQDLKEIIDDFEKLKKLHPKEFTLQLNEIANTIEIFKQKLSL